jgi:hypothetical protein
MLFDIERLGADRTGDAQFREAGVHFGLGKPSIGEDALLVFLKNSFSLVDTL